MKKNTSTNIDRRKFLLNSSAGLTWLALSTSLLTIGCKRPYQRKPEILDLGPVKDLLFDVQHIQDVACLVYRADKGWATLSTRCTYEGCELTYQEHTLLCPCCRSRYNHVGIKISGKAPLNLPWYAMDIKEKNLIANSGKVVPPGTPFTVPELEEAIRIIRENISERGVKEGVKIPKILLGKSDGEIGPMFKAYDPDELDEMYDIVISREIEGYDE